MNLKSILRALKTNEPAISTALGALVVLTVGILLVNYFRGKSDTGTIAPSAQTESAQAQVDLPAKHKVVSGESLWTIAEKYYKSGYNWVDLAKANNLTSPDVINEGTELTIPQVESLSLTVKEPTNMPQAPPSSTSNTQVTISGSDYITVQGDHLWNIAVRAYGDGYKWVEIAKANNLKNPNLIFVDQNLKLPR